MSAPSTAWSPAASASRSRKHFIRKDGSRLPVVIGAALVDGSRQHGVAYVQDITARRETESRLRESEARFRNMAEHAPTMLWVVEADGRCVYVNQNWHDYSGVPPGEDLAAGFFGALHPDDGEASKAAFLRAIASHTGYRQEARIRRRDGVFYRHMINHASPRFGPNGEFLGLIGVVMDIQDMKDAEEERRGSRRSCARRKRWRPRHARRRHRARLQQHPRRDPRQRASSRARTPRRSSRRTTSLAEIRKAASARREPRAADPHLQPHAAAASSRRSRCGRSSTKRSGCCARRCPPASSSTSSSAATRRVLRGRRRRSIRC